MTQDKIHDKGNPKQARVKLHLCPQLGGWIFMSARVVYKVPRKVRVGKPRQIWCRKQNEVSVIFYTDYSWIIYKKNVHAKYS